MYNIYIYVYLVVLNSTVRSVKIFFLSHVRHFSSSSSLSSLSSLSSPPSPSPPYSSSSYLYVYSSFDDHHMKFLFLFSKRCIYYGLYVAGLYPPT